LWRQSNVEDRPVWSGLDAVVTRSWVWS